jgi:preprotein translocase subunit SecF
MIINSPRVLEKQEGTEEECRRSIVQYGRCKRQQRRLSLLFRLPSVIKVVLISVLLLIVVYSNCCIIFDEVSAFTTTTPFARTTNMDTTFDVRRRQQQQQQQLYSSSLPSGDEAVSESLSSLERLVSLQTNENQQNQILQQQQSKQQQVQRQQPSNIRVERYARLPVWPVWAGVIDFFVGWIFGAENGSKLEQYFLGGRVCPMQFDGKTTSPFILLVHQLSII